MVVIAGILLARAEKTSSAVAHVDDPGKFQTFTHHTVTQQMHEMLG